jgi:NADPH:quinone reductase-like Zn-dependent oxidoreductase
MAVLLVGAAGAVADAVVSRLLNEGDEVRIVAIPSEEAERWRALGAHIARGDPEDPDLIERAAQNARSIVAFGNDAGSHDVLDAAIEGGLGARVGRLIVCCTAAPGRKVRDRVSRASLEHIVLITGAIRRGSAILRSRKVTIADVARAVDAADDLAGRPRLVLDLRRPEAWRALELEPPE